MILEQLSEEMPAPLVLAADGMSPGSSVKLGHPNSIVMDLAGSVDKELARENAYDSIIAGNLPVIRLNHVDSRWHDEDLEMLAGRRVNVIVPGISTMSAVERVGSRLMRGSMLFPEVESSSTNLRFVGEIGSSGHVARVIINDPWTGAERAGSRDGDLGDQLVGAARLLSRRGLRRPVDGSTPRGISAARFELDARAAAELGFSGKFCTERSHVRVALAIFDHSGS